LAERTDEVAEAGLRASGRPADSSRLKEFCVTTTRWIFIAVFFAVTHAASAGSQVEFFGHSTGPLSERAVAIMKQNLAKSSDLQIWHGKPQRHIRFFLTASEGGEHRECPGFAYALIWVLVDDSQHEHLLNHIVAYSDASEIDSLTRIALDETKAVAESADRIFPRAAHRTQ
jgi:hypothetical protein